MYKNKNWDTTKSLSICEQVQFFDGKIIYNLQIIWWSSNSNWFGDGVCCVAILWSVILKPVGAILSSVLGISFLSHTEA